MKIGFFVSKFPYSDPKINYPMGGSIYSMEKIITEMAKNNEIVVFTTAHDSKSKTEYHDNIKIFRYGTNFRFASSNIAIGLFYKPLKNNVDLICVSYDIPPSPLAAILFAKLKKIPMILIYRGDWDDDYGNFFRKLSIKILNKFSHILLSTATLIISSSKSYIEHSDHLKDYKEKIEVIPNAFDQREFTNLLSKHESRAKLGLDPNKKIILFFSYLYPHKNPEMVLKAFPKVLEHVPNSLLLFAGNGIMEKELKDLSKDLGLEMHVVFSGFINSKLRPFYYKSSDVFVLPSKKETFGNVIIEALYCGLPVIITDSCGCSDIIRETNGGIIIDNDLPYGEKIELISDSLIKLLNNPQESKKMTNRGIKYIKNCLTIEKTTNKLEKSINSIVSQNKKI